jgi:DNA polymerase III subunit beta
MQFTIHKEQLKDSVNKLKNCLASGSLNPILEHFLFEIKQGTLTMKATNNSVGMIWVTKVECEDEFSFTLPGLTLSSLVSSLDEDHIRFTYNPTSKDILLNCGKYEWESSSGATKDFPSFVIPENLNSFKLPENFQTLLKGVYFSISSDLSKPDLNSLCLDINKDNSKKINLISTDRIRLSCASSPVESDKHLRFIIPKNSVGELLKLDANVLMYDDSLRSVYFKQESISGTFVFKTVLTNSTYPDIYAYLNNNFEEKTVKIKKSDLIRALKRVKLTSDRLQKVGTIEFSNSKAIIKALGPSSKSKEEVNVDLTEVDTDLNPFNIKLDLMLEYLNQEDEELVNFKVIDTKCLVFDKQNYRHVLSIEN